MSHPIRAFARGVYRLHWRALWRASLIAAGPLCLVDVLGPLWRVSAYGLPGRLRCSLPGRPCFFIP